MGIEPKPFVKWAGGKRQLLDKLVSNLPENFNNYHEFFLGGGALYFKLYSLGLIKKAYLNDANEELINSYRVIQKNVYELIEELKKPHYINDAIAYYKIRGLIIEDKVLRAARFIYLNKTAYNGLYRVNKQGKFNVPFGKYKNPKILDEDNLIAVSEALKPAVLMAVDFSEVLKYAKKDDFAYFDPPYYPLTATANFTSYTSNDFSPKDQERLKETVDLLTVIGVKVMVSNSYTDFITQLYKNYKQVEVFAKRAISCKAESRGKVAEVVLMNW
ncbi:MAG: DNA adenine methylase [Candidatus Micrarchaeota archaeon]|nr:DNA adenine methylase [Candidatus Micrarchaeota archaeon]